MFCQKCGKQVPEDGKFCPACQAPVQTAGTNEAQQGYQQPTIIINNANNNTNTNVNSSGGMGPRAKNKWVSFLLCLFLGYLGAHKFYEGKILFGVVYIFTVGLCGIGWLVDLILILMKPNPYFV